MARDEAPPIGEELLELPVFPLPDLVVFPGTPVPLHLFEPRYRAMIEDRIAGGPRTLATVRLRPGYLADYHGNPEVELVGTVGRITAHRTNPDGTHDIVLHGVARVSLAELAPSPRGYRLANATVLADESDDDASRAGVRTLLTMATAVATRIRREHPEFALGVDGGERAGLVADVLADRFVRDPDLRQRLLVTRDVRSRMDLLVDAIGTILGRMGSVDGSRA